MKRTRLIFKLATWAGSLAALVLLVAYLAGAFHPKLEPGVAAAPEAEHPALAFDAKAEQVDEPAAERVPGTLMAVRETTISPRITAVIASIDARAADSVKAGQKLVELDSRDLEARQRQAEQAVAAAQARLTDARKNYERMQTLVSDGTIPRSQFDSAEAAYHAAQAQLEQAQAAEREATAGRSYATITAPYDGRIVDRYAEPGDTAMPGTPILKMYDPAHLRVEANVREGLTASLRPGQPLTVHLDAPNRDIEGRVQEIVPQAEPGSRTVLVKVALPEEPGLYPGMFARLVIPTGKSERTYIPETAVHRVGQLTYVWVGGGKAQPERRFVKLGDHTRGGGQVEVLSGLAPGETVGVPEA